MSEFTIHTDCLFDPKQKAFLPNISLKADPETGLITSVIHRPEDETLAEITSPDIDLRGKVVCPGFVDTHTHVFLHSYDEQPSVNQKRDESFVERVVRAVNHCRIALLAGYTTYRDLGSESMQEADTNIRDCINRSLIPGPRIFCATKVIASTAAYEPRTENNIGGTTLPAGCDAADGPDELRKAVRRRIGYGADIIKFYADYRRRIMRFPPKQQHPYIPSMKFQPEDPNPDYNVYSDEEMRVIVDEAEMANAPVSAHAHTEKGVVAAAKAGALTIEHGSRAGEKGLQAMKTYGTILVPTLSVLERLHTSRFPAILEQLKKAHEMGIRLACGGDTGTFPHGDNAREMELFMEAGISVEDTIEACTVGGWESCGGDRCGRRFGWFQEGCAADLVALDGDPRIDKKAFRKVGFVMKDGKVWKKDGLAVGMV